MYAWGLSDGNILFRSISYQIVVRGHRVCFVQPRLSMHIAPSPRMTFGLLCHRAVNLKRVQLAPLTLS